MRHFILVFIATSYALFLTSCASISTAPPQNQPLSWEHRAAVLSNIQQWNLKGLIALRTSQNAWSANWQWQQTKNNYTILLFGPLGSNSLKLTGNSGGVLLEMADGKRLTARDPESLLARQLGWRLPVSFLRYWVRGLPVPTLPAQKQFDDYHHLAVLMQNDWTIRYLRYTSINGMDVPNKIFLTNPNMSVKIIISEWQL
ncbi:MAG: outer membrane lipoprotein LolB [uncultured bacterium]|nr:MAG: outer membrane lipoprotein LolB [uncultured bacterium]